MAFEDLENDPEAVRLKQQYQIAEAMGDKASMAMIRQRIIDRVPHIQANTQMRQDVNPIQATAMGAMAKAMTMGRGAQEIAGKLTGNTDWEQSGAQGRQDVASEFAPLHEAYPSETELGAAIPGALIPGGAAGGILRRGLTSAAAAGLDPLLSTGGNVGEAAKGAVLGAAGNELGRTIGGAFLGHAPERGTGIHDNPVRTSVHDQELARAKELGWQLTPARKYDSPTMEQIEAGFARDPITAGPFHRVNEHNQLVANGIARETIGLHGHDRLTDQVLSDRAAHLGSEFERLVGGSSSFPVGPDFYQSLAEITKNSTEGVSLNPGPMKQVLDRLKSKADQQFMTVRDYQKTTSDLAKLARSTDDGAMSRLLYEARDALDFQFDKEFGNIQELGKVRQQWKSLKDIERSKAITQGDFRPSVYYNYLRRGGKHVTPGTPMNDLAIAGNYSSNSIPNSGTPTGMAMREMLNPLMLPATVARAATSRAYMGTGGRLFGGSGLIPEITDRIERVIPMRSLSDLLAPRAGRELAPYEAQKNGL